MFNNPLPAATGLLFSTVTIFLFLATLQKKRMASALLIALCLIDLAIYGLPIIINVPLKSITAIDAAKTKMINQNKTYRRIALNNQPVWDGYFLATGYAGIVPRQYFDYSKIEHLRLASISHGYLGENAVPVVENPLPRIRLASELRQVNEPLNNLENIALSEVVLCEIGVGSSFKASPLSRSDQLDIVQDGFDKIEIHVTVENQRILVISDYWNEDWKATIDGRQTALLPLFSGAIRGIAIEPGTHSITLVYEPRYLRSTRILSAIGWCGILSLILLGLIQRHRSLRSVIN